MNIIESARLNIRELNANDTAFIIELVNDPSWIRFIGERNIRTSGDALQYIDKARASYAQNAFGLWMVELKETGSPLGICGFLKRDTLDHEDIGFAFLPQHTGQGYAQEACAAVLEHGRSTLGLKTILAITALDNERSIKLLGKLGFRYQKIINMDGQEEASRLFSLQF